ncbi:hypothetical protein AALP_AA3G095100 [Arabis alpina]|uniref:Uncharacterized protein n=1 Tax=Arabis alpina TaxID=50452 RepID=A0A087H839_ARAAL|nr:hypothetical protein AALP_AA3G095100 [Arabis alpina]
MMLPILRTVIARGGRSVVSRRSFNTAAPPTTSNTLKDAVGNTWSKSLRRFTVSFLFGHSIYAAWDAMGMVEYYGTQIAYADDKAYGVKQGDASVS